MVFLSGSITPSKIFSWTCWNRAMAALVLGPQIPSTARNGMGPPAALATVTRFNASWMVRTSSGLLRASGPRPTGWLMAIGPELADERPGRS